MLIRRQSTSVQPPLLTNIRTKNGFSALIRPEDPTYDGDKRLIVDSNSLLDTSVELEEPEALEDELGREEDMALQLPMTTEPEVNFVPVAQAEVPVARQDHEVIEKLMTAMIEDGRLAKDADGRHVVMMSLKVPGRGDVRVRLWNKPEGLDLKLRASDPDTRRLLQKHTNTLRRGLLDRGLTLSHLEVK